MIATLKAWNKDIEHLQLTFTIILKDFWSKTLLEPGDLVRIIGVFSQENKFRLTFDEEITSDKERNVGKGKFVILEPYLLITSTSISSAAEWPRIPLLRELFKNSEGNPNYQLTLGNIIHLVFQRIFDNLEGKSYSPNL